MKKKYYTTLLLLLVAIMVNAQSCPDNNHPHAIDLGLPSGTKWACCNVGATAPEKDGGYYAWGETTEKSNYTWETYKHCNGSSNTCTNIPNIQGSANDVAKARMGSSWNMPTSAQFDELKIYTAQTWTTINGINGMKFTGTNGKSIFLPASGYKTRYSVLKGDKIAKYGPNFYWTSQENSYSSKYYQYAKTFWFQMLQSDTGRDTDRKEGLPVRAIYTGFDPLPTKLTIYPESKTIKVGETFTIDIKIDPSNANPNCTCESSAPTIASVLTKGEVAEVTGLKEGTATISVTTINNITKYCTVKVTDTPNEPDMTLLSYKYENENNLNSLTQNDKLIVQAIWKNIGETAEVYTQLALKEGSNIVCRKGSTQMFNKNEEVTITYELPLTSVKPGQYTSIIYWYNNKDNMLYHRSSWEKSVTIIDKNSEVIATTATNNALIKIARKQGWIASNATQMTKADAEKITDVSQAFAYNRELVSFDEFEYFTGVKKLTPYDSYYNGTFAGCENLKSIKLPNTITNIGNHAFDGCSSLENITLPPSLTTIGECAFSSSGLTSITLPPSLTSIGAAAFRWTNITSISLPSSITKIEGGTFLGCGQLTSVTMPSSIISLGAEAFAQCFCLKNITLSTSLTSIGPSAFESCFELNSITLPETLKSIDDFAFRGCHNITNIAIPKNVSTIGSGIVWGCNITQITVNSSNHNVTVHRTRWK